MIRKVCSILLLGGFLYSAASAQDHQLFASAATATKMGISMDNASESPLPKPEKSIVLLPDLKADAKLQIDSIFGFAPQKDPFTIKARSFIMPGVLMAAGTYSLFNEDCKDFNKFTKDGIGNKRDNEGFVPDHITMFLPFMAYYGVRAAGVKSQHNMLDATLIYTMASVINNSVVFVVKNRSAVERPDASDLLSFPSGHTAQAFVSAEFLRQEYKDVSPWYGVAGYAAAVGTGLLRMRHNKHWLNDVVAGAGLGIASTRLSYWLYPKLKNLVAPNAKSDMMIAPSYNNGAYGLSFMYRFK